MTRLATPLTIIDLALLAHERRVPGVGGTHLTLDGELLGVRVPLHDILEARVLAERVHTRLVHVNHALTDGTRQKRRIQCGAGK